MKLQYVVVYQKLPNNYCAYIPELPGCICTGDNWEEIQEMVHDAVGFYLESMLEDGDHIPQGAMSLEDAIAYHCQPLTEEEEKALGDDHWPPVLSITFAPIEVEVPAPQLTASN